MMIMDVSIQVGILSFATKASSTKIKYYISINAWSLYSTYDLLRTMSKLQEQSNRKRCKTAPHSLKGFCFLYGCVSNEIPILAWQQSQGSIQSRQAIGARLKVPKQVLTLPPVSCEF